MHLVCNLESNILTRMALAHFRAGEKLTKLMWMDTVNVPVESVSGTSSSIAR